MVSAHKDDYDYLKANFERVSEVLAEPLVVSPPEGGEMLPVEKNIEIESSQSLDWSRVNQPMAFWKDVNNQNRCQCVQPNNLGTVAGMCGWCGKFLPF